MQVAETRLGFVAILGARIELAADHELQEADLIGFHNVHTNKIGTTFQAMQLSAL